MKKLSLVLLVTLLLGLCSCAPSPNGEQIFAIKDPQSIELTNGSALALSAFVPRDAIIRTEDEDDIEAICDLLNGLTLTEVDGSGGVLGGISIHIDCSHLNRNITVQGTIIHCEWNEKSYRADRDITDDLMAYLTREVGIVSSGKDLFQIDKINRITVTDAQWEEIEMTDIAPAVEALSGLTLTRANTPRLEGGLHATVYLQDGNSSGITFGSDLMQVNNKMYQVDRNISDIFSAVIHP